MWRGKKVIKNNNITQGQIGYVMILKTSGWNIGGKKVVKQQFSPRPDCYVMILKTIRWNVEGLESRKKTILSEARLVMLGY